MNRPQARGPIRIGFVLHVMQVAGAEMLVAETIRRLGDRLDPIVICLDDVGQLGERVRAEGIPVVALHRRPGLDLSVGRGIASIISDRRLEVLHAHQYTPFFYTAAGRLLARRPVHVMFTEHGRHYPDVVSAKRRVANRLVLSRFADEINGVCRFSIDSLARNDGFSRRPLEVIDNGIDVARYAPAGPAERAAVRRGLGLDPARRLIVCIARFHPVKDHEMLMRAFAGVAAERTDVDLLLAGGGPRQAELEQLAGTLGIANRVHFLGVRTDVPDLLRASDIFTLTSVSEAASLTLLEAMATALPVVVTAVGGNPEIVVDRESGLLVPRGDHRAAAAAFLELLNRPAVADRLGRAARERVEARFTLDGTIQNYYARYAAAAARLRGDRRAAA